jgi:hypothetical protein
MTPQQIGLLLIQLAVSLGILGFIGVALIRSSESAIKYKLFSVRDKFLYLAASGVLPQNTMVFKVFYKSMNIFISEIESLTIVSFIRASVSVRKQLEKEDRTRLIESLDRADPRVKEAVDEFLRVVMEAIRYNSPMLNLGLGFAAHCARLVGLLRSFTIMIFQRPFRPPVYDTYRYYESIHGSMMRHHDFDPVSMAS